MRPTRRNWKTGLVKVLSLFLAFAWVASDAAQADQSRAGSTRGSASTRSGGSSSSGGSVSTGSSRAGSSSADASRRSAVPRSSAGPRGQSGAAQTRPYGGSASSRPHHGGSYHGYYGNRGISFGFYGYPRYWNPFWGFWSFGYGYEPGYGMGYGYYPPVVYSNHRGYRMGALDLAVRPKNAEVYVDGQYVGLARQYDGFPGHLWLEKGTYEIAFYSPGFETQTRTVKILTDLILDMEIEMSEGQAVKPEMRPEAVGGERPSDDYARRPLPEPQRGPALMQSRVHLEVEPGNAVVYLDGNLLGTGDELAGLRAGLILSAGMHVLEVSREGFETLEERVVIEPGEEVDLSFELQPLARAGV